jgi:hypothetical protein
MEVKFPRTLYKRADIEDETAFKWGKWKTGKGGAYHSLVVVNDEEYEEAHNMGYIDSLEEVCNGPKAAEDGPKKTEKVGNNGPKKTEKVGSDGPKKTEKTVEVDEDF